RGVLSLCVRPQWCWSTLGRGTSLSLDDLLLEQAVEIAARYVTPVVDALRERVACFRALRTVESQDAFRDYYLTTIRRYGRTKTLLYRTESVPLYDFYVNLDVGLSDRLWETAHIGDLLQVGRSLLLTGDAGCGKSTLLKHIFLQSIA